MRGLFFLLAAANAAFAVYLYFGSDRGGEPQLMQQQLHPDKVRVLKEAPAKPAQAPAACLEWGAFAGDEMARAEAALAKLELGDRVSRKSVERAGGYWVYIPPLKTRQDADKKINELKTRAVADYFLVQDSVKWRNAISLGIFSTREAADKRLNELKEKGVKSAVAGERTDPVKHVLFVIRDPSQTAAARLVELQQEFAGSELAAAACN